MISHDHAQALISARMDEILPPAEQRELAEHLAGCPSCRAFASHFDRMARDLRGMPQLPPSPAVARGVLAGIRQEDRSFLGWLGSLQFSPGPLLAVASSLVLVAALAYTVNLALNRSGSAPAPEQAKATIAAVALAVETPTPALAPTRAVPTALPTRPAVETFAPAVAIATTVAKAVPTATVPSIQAPPSPTPAGQLIEVASVPTAAPAVAQAQVPVANPSTSDAPAVAQAPVDTSLAQAPAADDSQSAADTSQPVADTGQAVDASQQDDGTLALAQDVPADQTGDGSGDTTAGAAPVDDTAAATDSTDDQTAMRAADATTGDGSGDQAAAEPTIEPTDDTAAANGTTDSSGDTTTDAAPVDPTPVPDSGGVDPSRPIGPGNPPARPTPHVPPGFGDGGKMQVNLSAGVDGQPASISVEPIPPTPTPIPPTPDATATAAAAGDSAAEPTPAQ